MFFLIAVLLTASRDEIRVSNVQELRAAVASAKPGTKILLKAGEYPGGLHFSNVHGTAERQIEIGAQGSDSVRFVGGGGLQFSEVSHMVLSNLRIERATHNGLNIDDGGTPETPSHHVTLHQLRVTDLPPGNRDGIKLSGVEDFTIKHCVVERWGGSAIDMVGCHRGLIADSTFNKGGDSAVQAKGGSSNITVRKCSFEDFGQRGVNIGGSTGFEFFRPALAQVPSGKRAEAKNITVEGCTFSGGVAPIAFVGVDGARLRFNTLYHPGRWAVRILQETRDPSFVSSRNGRFEDNLIVFLSSQWSEGGVNIGPGTSPESFKFARNFWYCSDQPARSAPKLPTPEVGGVIGQDPKLKPDLTVEPASPASKVGAHAFRG